MNRQDQIFEYSFGEMSAQDAQVFEASLLNDFEAQKEINLLKGLRSDFSLLSDVPEMQFSKERLRNAILDQGIQPKQRLKINWLQWLLAPTAVASLAALAFVVTRTGGFEDKSQMGTARLGRNGMPMAATMELKVPGFQEDEVAPSAGKPITSPTASSTTVVATNVRPSAKRIRTHRPLRSSGNGLLASAVRTQPSGPPAFDARADREAIISSAGLAGGAAGPSFESASPASLKMSEVAIEDRTVIVIDKEQESGVGAVVATEVSVSPDVVIGG